MEDNHAYPCNRRRVSINDLSDDDLLAIFDFYVVKYQDLGFHALSDHEVKRQVESWQSLVHVCRRWRRLVFGSPRHLNLQLLSILGTSARKSLDVWPALPLLIHGGVSETSVDETIAELHYNDRISQISLECHTTSQIEKLWTAMQVPFPELTRLYLSLGGMSYAPVLPDSFLGGSAPSLRYLALAVVPFPGLPKLLLSATHLVELLLLNIPHAGYISPEVMATCLSMLTSLETFHLKFESPQSGPDPDSQRTFPPTRFVLSTLSTFSFKGVNEYLEEFVAQINAPRLYGFSITFFNDIEFDTPELIQFISRSSISNALIEAHVVFDSHLAWVDFRSQAYNLNYFEVKISCREPGWQLSSLTQICTLVLPLFSTTKSLFIYEPAHSRPSWKDGIENIEWLELLLPFTAVKTFYLSMQIAPRIAPALQETAGDGTTEVLPTLEKFYLESFPQSKSVQEDTGKSTSAQLLVDMGATVAQARAALKRYSDVMEAAEHILDGDFDDIPDEPAAISPLSEAVQEDLKKFISARQLTNRHVTISTWERYPKRDIINEIRQLVDMGATVAQARAALERYSDVMEAAEHILDGDYDDIPDESPLVFSSLSEAARAHGGFGKMTNRDASHVIISTQERYPERGIESEIRQLVDTGATVSQARAAFERYSDVMEAAEHIFDGDFDNVPDEPAAIFSPLSEAIRAPGGFGKLTNCDASHAKGDIEREMRQLVDMGATAAQVRAALERYSDVMEAAEQIFDGAFDNIPDESTPSPG